MAIKSPPAKRLDVFEVPEVVAFMNARDKLEALKEQYPEVFAYLQVIGEEYNATREAAEKAVRAREVSCGPFEAYQWATTYDPVALYDAVGKERFLELGGKINTIETYEVDKERMEAVIAAGKLPGVAILAFRKRAPKYHALPKVMLP